VATGRGVALPWDRDSCARELWLAQVQHVAILMEGPGTQSLSELRPVAGARLPGPGAQDRRRVKLWTAVLSAQRDPHLIPRALWESILEARAAGAINAYGEPLSPARECCPGLPMPTEKNPRRPVASQDRLDALRAVSDQLVWGLGGTVGAHVSGAT
jgi:hypothetical protein